MTDAPSGAHDLSPAGPSGPAGVVVSATGPSTLSGSAAGAAATGPAAAGRVEAVCIVFAIRPTERSNVDGSAIDKRPVAGPVDVAPLGLAGDTQCDRRHHGGLDQAVYAYADEDAAHWATELGRDIAPGSFGENLRVSGLDLTAAVIGERWAVGDELVLEVTAPRIPCATFAVFTGEPRWVKRFTAARRLGAYLRVVRPGPVAAGDAVRVTARPHHGVGVGAVFPDADPAALRVLLTAADAGEVDLAASVRARAEAVAGRS